MAWDLSSTTVVILFLLSSFTTEYRLVLKVAKFTKVNSPKSFRIGKGLSSKSGRRHSGGKADDYTYSS